MISAGRRGNRRPASAGFTLAELVMVLVLVGLLAVVALPRFSGSSEFRNIAFRDEVAAALRYAQKSAVSHRRLVCAVFTPSSVTLHIAATNPAAACGSATLNGPDGKTAFAQAGSDLMAGGLPTLHFQPSGLVTSAAGVVMTHTVGISGASAVTVVGATGHVE